GGAVRPDPERPRDAGGVLGAGPAGAAPGRGAADRGRPHRDVGRTRRLGAPGFGGDLLLPPADVRGPLREADGGPSVVAIRPASKRGALREEGAPSSLRGVTRQPPAPRTRSRSRS